MLEGTLTLELDGGEVAHARSRTTPRAWRPRSRRRLSNRGDTRVALLALGGAEPHVGRDGLAYTDWDETRAGRRRKFPCLRPVRPGKPLGFCKNHPCPPPRKASRMSVTDELLKNNEAYAASFDKGDLPAAARQEGRRRRLHGRPPRPGRRLGLNEGDAHVIRNAGGVVTDDAIRSLAICSACSAPRRSSSSTTPTAGCSPSPTTQFAEKLRTRPARRPSGAPRVPRPRGGRPRSRSSSSRRARSSRTRTPSAASSTRWSRAIYARGVVGSALVRSGGPK